MINMTIRTDAARATINRNIFGHFAEHLGRCIYEGIWVGHDSAIPNTDGIRNDVIGALRQLSIPVLRWPGGCFADEYHWKDGIGPYAERPRMINTHWGGVEENNHFGTHEFFRLCELIGAEPYICGNLGSGTVQEMQQWVEYMTSDGESPMADWRRKNGRAEPWKLNYFGVGNENWGCGGNMRPEYYADEYRRYATYVRNFGDNRISRIACGPNSADYHWTEVLMREAGRYMKGLTLHYYTLPTGEWKNKGSSTEFGVAEWFATLKNTLFMEELIQKHSAIMDQYDPDKKVGLLVDEWGTWYDVEPGTNPGFLYQQNTLRDALVAGVNLNLFMQHCDRVRMANIAQTVNVLQAIMLTDGDRLVLTPTYHVFDLFKVHQDGVLLPIELEQTPVYSVDGAESIPQLSVAGSKDANGRIHLSVCNLHHAESVEIACSLADVDADAAAAVAGSQVSGKMLTHAALNAHNTFEQPDAIVPVELQGITLANGVLRFTLPPASVAVLTVEGKVIEE